MTAREQLVASCQNNVDYIKLREEDRAILKQLIVPIPINEAKRLEVLRRTQLLDSDTNDEEYDRFTSLIKRMYQVI
jgi:hypothetical protein